MWDIAICDDNPADARQLAEKIEALHLSQMYRIREFNSGHELLDEIADERIKPSLVMMNIHLAEENGIELAAQLNQLRPGCQIIFLSDCDIYSESVYDVEHIYFLRKPVSAEALSKAVEKAANRLERVKEECLCIHNKSGDFVIPLDEIYSLEKDKRKIAVRTVQGVQCSFYGKFEDVEEQLKGWFVRCHYSFIVNLYRVKYMGKDFFILWDDRKIPISRTYVKQVRQRFTDFAGKEYDCRKTF